MDFGGDRVVQTLGFVDGNSETPLEMPGMPGVAGAGDGEEQGARLAEGTAGRRLLSLSPREKRWRGLWRKKQG